MHKAKHTCRSCSLNLAASFCMLSPVLLPAPRCSNLSMKRNTLSSTSRKNCRSSSLGEVSPFAFFDDRSGELKEGKK